jgi:deoxyribodipyrimidine photo-lyase
MTKKSIFWFRQDLRLSDNPGLYEAIKSGLVIAVYILDDEAPAMGGASKWWLYNSLLKLNKSLDNNLNLYKGSPKEILLKLIKGYQIDSVYWNRCYDPWRIREDREIKIILKNQSIDCKSFNSLLLWEPWEVSKNDGEPYKVFTPFYRNGCMRAKPPRKPSPRPEKLNFIKDLLNSSDIEELELLPTIKWYSSMENQWEIGEEGAQNLLNTFLDNGLQNYKEGRNFPGKNHTSRLSPYLHFGEISPNQIWYRIQNQSFINPLLTNDAEHFLRELCWREFSYSLLYYFPELPRKNFQGKFDKFLWHFDQKLLEAWQKGGTGYPIIDAGMRELWQTGYMHNRVRMIVGSFLTKNLLFNWRHGAEWFWDCLVDSDLANNNASWQWVAGTGADAAPYFRIFNPITQGEKFDPDGIYTKHFIPELNSLPIKYLFNPWKSPEQVLKESNIILGETYPKPIIDLDFSRKRALEIYKTTVRLDTGNSSDHNMP